MMPNRTTSVIVAEINVLLEELNKAVEAKAATVTPDTRTLPEIMAGDTGRPGHAGIARYPGT